MRFSSLFVNRLPRGLAVGALVLGMSACLPTYKGNAPGDFAVGPDADHVNTPPTSDPDPIPPPEDLAGTVLVDMFTSSGASTISLSDPTATLRLNETKTVTLTITPNGVTGTATLALMNAPTGVTAVFTPASITLGATPINVTMSVTAAGDMTAVSSVAANVQLAAGSAISTTTFGISVVQELLVTIAKGVALTNDPTAFGAASIPVQYVAPGTKVTFVNQDTIEHRIHADGTGGIAHEPNNMAANGGTYTQTINATGDISFYCHIHPGMKGVIAVK